MLSMEQAHGLLADQQASLGLVSQASHQPGASQRPWAKAHPIPQSREQRVHRIADQLTLLPRFLLCISPWPGTEQSSGVLVDPPGDYAWKGV